MQCHHVHKERNCAVCKSDTATRYRLFQQSTTCVSVNICFVAVKVINSEQKDKDANTSSLLQTTTTAKMGKC